MKNIMILLYIFKKNEKNGQILLLKTEEKNTTPI